MLDGLGRNIDYIRISVTDKCNLRCVYCMPKEGIQCIRHEDILEFEEITRICECMAKLGVKKVKLTGGEPLVRKDFVKLVTMINNIDSIESITLTTNGVLLKDMAKDLKNAGVDSVNISLDTLNPEKYKEITLRDEFHRVIEGIDAAYEVGLNVKINVVASKDFNLDEIVPLALIAKDRKIDVRFIEIMPIGCGREFEGISGSVILEILEKSFGKSKVSTIVHGNGPASYVDFKGFLGSIGFISPMSHKFCSKCNRVRLSAEGKLKLCLHYNDGIDLKEIIRNTKDDEELLEKIKEAMIRKPSEHNFEKDDLSNVEEKKMVSIGG